MDERMRFIGERLERRAGMAELCRRYGISRKTGYKLWARYQGEGAAGVGERSRRPHHLGRAVAEEVEAAVVQLRTTYPCWGPRKLRVYLARTRPTQRWPAASTIGALLARQGLSRPRRRRPRAAPATQPLAGAGQPNDVWSADFKGWFRTGDGARCLPFTLTDNASRFLLRCQAVPRGDTAAVRPLLEAAFREYGLPQALRTDNGPPFATLGVGGLSRLAIWVIKLGICADRIAPGHPEQNGRHERMHWTLAQETARPPAPTGRAQQQRFDAFRHVFNTVRPHEALGQQPPATVYTPSPRPSPARVREPEYPADYLVRRVRTNGEIRWARRLLFVGDALAGELLGLEEVLEDCWRLRFGPVVLGWIDGRTTHRGRPPRLSALRPPNLLPMCPV
jgi:transposase InsO family protein